MMDTHYVLEKLGGAVEIFITDEGTASQRLRQAYRYGKLLPILALLDRNISDLPCESLVPYAKRLKKALYKYGSVKNTTERIQNSTASKIMLDLFSFYDILRDID